MTTLHVYSDRSHELEFQEIARYIKETTVLDSEAHGHLFDLLEPRKPMANDIAGLKITDFYVEGALNSEPTRADISREKELMIEGKPIEFDVENVYEGFRFIKTLRPLIPKKLKGFHLVFTSRMLATWENNRYHGRAIICGSPLSVVSTTGMVEAPAKPKEYYARLLARQRASNMGLDVPDEATIENELKAELSDRILDYDGRLMEAVKGYALQAVSFFLTYEAFCKDPDCRLYNAHTQEDLIHAQLVSGKICKTHKRILGG